MGNKANTSSKRKNVKEKYTVVEDSALCLSKMLLLKLLSNLIYSILFVTSKILKTIFLTLKIVFTYIIRLGSSSDGKIAIILVILLSFSMICSKIEVSQLENIAQNYVVTIEKQGRVISEQTDLLLKSEEIINKIKE